ncbi:MAG: glycosyltransferase family 4 protein [Cyanobacteria bacterium J06614_10]
MKIGYLIPEFPGQTHIWMWREIIHMREWGAEIDIFSTREPDAKTRAKHAFAQAASEKTYYLWPQPSLKLIRDIAWAIARHPSGFIDMLKLCFTLDLKKQPAWKETLPLALLTPALAKEALSRNIQHFHVHSCSRSAVLAMMVKRLVGIPFSMTLNAKIEGWGGAMEQKFLDAAFTISITDWLLAQMRADYQQLDDDKALLGRIGVDTTKWYPAETLPNPEEGGFRLITVGRLHPCKGHDVLIKTVKRILDSGRDITLKIVGSGPIERELKALVKTLGLTEHVTFTGSLSEDQIIALMHQSHAFALASHAEALGVVYMEAMSMGVPTIGTNAGGVTEIISDQQDGLLVPPRDEVALQAAIERVMDDPELRKQLSQNGRKSIVERFDSRIGAATLYQKLYGEYPNAEGVAVPAEKKTAAVSS